MRVRYRQERREAIAEIVASAAKGSAITAIAREAARRIPAADQGDFMEDLHEDLAMLTPARIASIGITAKQLRDWLALRDRE